MGDYYIKRTRLGDDLDISIYGKGIRQNADGYESERLAIAAMKRLQKQDEELCPELCIRYEVIDKT